MILSNGIKTILVWLENKRSVIWIRWLDLFKIMNVEARKSEIEKTDSFMFEENSIIIKETPPLKTRKLYMVSILIRVYLFYSAYYVYNPSQISCDVDAYRQYHPKIRTISKDYFNKLIFFLTKENQDFLISTGEVNEN